jgi:hypothetical protein
MSKMTNCKSCGAEIATSAKSCPKCGAKNKKPIWKRVWVWILAVIILFAAIGSTGGSSDTDTSAPSTDINTPVVQEPINYTVVSVIDMMDALDTNALKAEKTYDNQYLEITGRLGVIDSDGSYISLYGGDFDFTGVQCYIKNDEQLNFVMDMIDGDTYTVRVKIIDVGEVLGYQADIVEFVK